MAEGPKDFFSERSKSLFHRADGIELLSLHPSEMRPTVRETLDPGGDPVAFRGWMVLGRLRVEGTTQQLLLQVLEAGVSESDGRVARCFNPRHGIRATSDGHLFDMVICFECFSILVFEDRTKTEIVTVTGSPELVLNNILEAAGIPLAPNDA